MPFHFFQSLRFRLIASVVAIEVVMLSVLVWNNVNTIYKTHTDRLNDTAQSILQQFTSVAGAYIAEVDYAVLEERAKNAMQQNEVAYLHVLNLKGDSILQINKNSTVKPHKADRHPTQVEDGYFDLSRTIEIAGRPIGSVMMGFSLELMEKNISDALHRSIIIATTGISLSILATILLGMGFTRELKGLAIAATKVGDGEYDTLLKIQRNDEIGMTARAFNKMVNDVGERSRKLEESQAWSHLLMDSTAEAIVGVDNNSVCMFVNQACLRMLGYSRAEDIVGKDFHDLSHYKHPDGTPYPAEECVIRNGAKNEGLFHCNTEMFCRADGSLFPVDAWTHPITDHGERNGMVMTFMDITDRKKSEDDVERLNRQVHLLLESTGEGIFGVDPDMHCTFINRAAADMLGYTVKEVLGQDMHKLIHYTYEDGSVYPREDSLIYRSINKNMAFESDDEILWTKSGTTFPAQYSTSPISDNKNIIGAAIIFRNISEAKTLARQMDYLVRHDSLTGLFNRREFDARLKNYINDSRIEKTTHVLCYLDLDQFKVVNDTCGHIAGDELLKQLAGVLQEKIRKYDVLARLGGDEFGLILLHTDTRSAAKTIEEIRHSVRDFRFQWDNNKFTVSVSIGVTEINTKTGDISHAMSEADAACYIAKEQGRNRIHVFEVDDEDIAKRHGEMQWVSVINNALDKNRFFLHFQPIESVNYDISKPDKKHIFKHFEILLRLEDEDGNNIPPGAFIPAAERYSLMQSVDSWVINAVFKWLNTQQTTLNQIETCAINLSAQSINDVQFLEYINNQLVKWNIPPEKICFEITETAAVTNLSKATEFMRKLKAHGCRFSLDDFGSGMSSFAYLKNLPVDYLKIDGHFVKDIVDDKIDYAMVDAINRIGQVMGIKTIAEFVENEAILQCLQDIGVNYVQGYGIAKPCSLDEMLNKAQE